MQLIISRIHTGKVCCVKPFRYGKLSNIYQDIVSEVLINMTAIQKKRSFLISFYVRYLFWNMECKEYGTTESFLTEFTDYCGRFESILLPNFFLKNSPKLFWESSCDSKKIKGKKILFIILFVENIFQMSRKEFSITTFEKPPTI